MEAATRMAGIPTWSCTWSIILKGRALSPTSLPLRSACRHFPAEHGMLLPFFTPVCVCIVDTTHFDIHPEIITYCPSILCTLGLP